MKSEQRVSVVKLAELLREVISSRHFASLPTLTAAVLRSQGALAKFCDEELGIVASSLNTLKVSANAHLPGGFRELDNARKTALDYRIRFDASLQVAGGARTKVALQQKVSELEEVERRLEEDLFHISDAFNEAIRKARAIVNASGRADLARRWKDEEAELLARASLVRSRIRRVS